MRIFGLFLLIILMATACKTTKNASAIENQVAAEPVIEEVAINENEIDWMTWDEVVKAQQKRPKKVFIDVYTDWCGWCKKMDKSTFIDKSVIKALNKDFYAIKFDAEQKEVIKFKGQDYVYVGSGRRGAHQLAKSLLDGRMGYPSFVYLDENLSRIMPSPGFKQVDQLLRELSYISTESYTKMDLEKYN